MKEQPWLLRHTPLACHAWSRFGLPVPIITIHGRELRPNPDDEFIGATTAARPPSDWLQMVLVLGAAQTPLEAMNLFAAGLESVTLPDRGAEVFGAPQLGIETVFLEPVAPIRVPSHDLWFRIGYPTNSRFTEDGRLEPILASCDEQGTISSLLWWPIDQMIAGFQHEVIRRLVERFLAENPRIPRTPERFTALAAALPFNAPGNGLMHRWHGFSRLQLDGDLLVMPTTAVKYGCEIRAVLLPQGVSVQFRKGPADAWHAFHWPDFLCADDTATRQDHTAKIVGDHNTLIGNEQADYRYPSPAVAGNHCLTAVVANTRTVPQWNAGSLSTVNVPRGLFVVRGEHGLEIFRHDGERHTVALVTQFTDDGPRMGFHAMDTRDKSAQGLQLTSLIHPDQSWLTLPDTGACFPCTRRGAFEARLFRVAQALSGV